MTNPTFSKFDGSNRAPRAIQTSTLKWISDNWSSKVLACNLPTGVGKSAILRAIQLEFPGSVGIVPSNILLDQYRTTYSELNYLKGVAQYVCLEDSEYTCQDRKLLKQPPCEGCTYKSCRERALTESTIFNPISYHYLTKTKSFVKSQVTIIDEAHKLIDTLMLLVDISFRKGKYDYPEINTELELLDWLKVIKAKITLLIAKYKKSGQSDRIIEHIRKIDKIDFLIKSLETNPQDFVFFEREASYKNSKDKYLCIQPIKPPKWILDTIFENTDKVILLSATLLVDDLWKLGIKDYRYLDVPSPIPKEQRVVEYLPSGFSMNYKSEPSDIANYIKKAIASHNEVNCVVHVSYTWSNKLKPFFPNALFNTPETKNQVLDHFKKTGGLWIASGCSEGLDLPDNECRLIIIPLIVLGNPKDPVTAKQLALPYGRLSYELKAIKTVIQQAGRGTRSETDYSTTIIGDNKFPNLILKNKKFIPKSFIEAIIWSKPNVKT